MYELCLKGNEHLGSVTPADFDRAEQYFQRALAKDPASAAAYAGMAGVWIYRQQMGLAPPWETGPKARTAALKAIELDDQLAESYLRLAEVFMLTDFNLPGAEREFKRTLELDPSNPEARAVYAHVLLILGRPGEAMPQIERAVANDPLDVAIRMFYAATLLFVRRYDEAIAEAEAILRVQPGHIGALGVVVGARHMKHQYAEVIAAEALTYEQVGRPDVAKALKESYAESGYAAALRQAADVELTKHAGGLLGGAAYDAASNYAMAGDRARALNWLEKAHAERDPNMLYIGCYPFFDSLRTEPRFQTLLRKMNLPMDSPPPTSK